MQDPDFSEHAASVPAHHRFGPVHFRGQTWDLAHLEPFAIKVDLGELGSVDVVVLFSCHCFTRDVGADVAPPPGEVYWDGRERRILDEQRHELSKRCLRLMVRELPRRTVRMAQRENFFSMEAVDLAGTPHMYTMFFEISRDARRRRRLFLRVQTAYTGLHMTKQLREAVKVRFETLVRKTFQGQKVHR